jgi:hypothetical protein
MHVIYFRKPLQPILPPHPLKLQYKKLLCTLHFLLAICHYSDSYNLFYVILLIRFSPTISQQHCTSNATLTFIRTSHNSTYLLLVSTHYHKLIYNSTRYSASISLITGGALVGLAPSSSLVRLRPDIGFLCSISNQILFPDNNICHPKLITGI